MFFFYNIFGDAMKIYVDLILLLNLAFDFLLLFGVAIILKRKLDLFRLLLAAFIGSLTVLFLFTSITSITLFFLKLVISIVMLLIAFGYKTLNYTIKNIIYLYLLSIVLGGCLYLVNISVSYKREGLIFINNGLSTNFLLLLIISPICIYIYIKQVQDLKINNNNYKNVLIYLDDNNIIKCTGYIDSGNKLQDPITKKKVILIDKKKIIYDLNNFKMVLVPYNALNHTGLVKCLKIKKVDVDNKIYKNYLLGLMDDLKMDGVECLLNARMEE